MERELAAFVDTLRQGHDAMHRQAGEVIAQQAAIIAALKGDLERSIALSSTLIGEIAGRVMTLERCLDIDDD